MNSRNTLTALFLTCMLSASAYAGGGNAVCEEPNVLLVLDRSGSMQDNNKWNIAVSAVESLANTFQSSMRLGLEFFPYLNQCGVGASNIVVPVGPASGARISQELRSSSNRPDGGTPTASALNEARNYYNQLNDRDRRSMVVLITDGEPSCNSSCNNAIQAAQNLFDREIKTYVIGFGNGSNKNCNDAVARAGGTDESYVAFANSTDLNDRLEEALLRALEEVCDAKDNDCDGRIDEGLTERPCDTTCGEGIERCIEGRYTTCAGGEIPMESCNGLDDDCDNLTDENVTLPCTTVSGEPGMQLCVNGMFEEGCTPVDPTREEICDGFDNNTNGQVDENTDELCEVDCHQGRRRCVDGNLQPCSAQPAGEESCNGEDDDCDGKIDEGEPCVQPEVCENGQCLQPCQANECSGGYECRDDDLCAPPPCVPDCAPEQKCQQAICYDRCILDRDCQEGYVCENTLCVRDTSTPINPMTGDAGTSTTARPDGGSYTPVFIDAGVDEDQRPGGFQCRQNNSKAPLSLVMLLLGVFVLRRRPENR